LIHITFDRETSAELLAQSQPKVIANDRENEQAIALAEELSHRSKRSSRLPWGFFSSYEWAAKYQ
jgi:hypothetical protein